MAPKNAFQKGNKVSKGRPRGASNRVQVPKNELTQKVHDLQAALQAAQAPPKEELIRPGYSGVLDVPVKSLRKMMDLVQDTMSGLMYDAAWRGLRDPDPDVGLRWWRAIMEYGMGRPGAMGAATPAFPLQFLTVHPIGGNYDPMRGPNTPPLSLAVHTPLPPEDEDPDDTDGLDAV